MESKTFAVLFCLILGALLMTSTEASPVANELLTGHDLGKPVNNFPATKVGGRRGRYYGGYPYGGYNPYGGYGGYPYGGGFGGSSAAASASASSSGFGFGR